MNETVNQHRKSPMGSAYPYVAVSACWASALISAYGFPMLVGPLMTVFSLDEAKIGLLTGAESGGIALSSAWLSGRTRATSLQRLGWMGVAGACAGHALTLFAPSFGWFLAGRLIAGLGAGVLLTSANVAAAAVRNPERAFAIAQVANGSFTAVVLAVTPFLVAVGGHRAGIGLLIPIIVLCVPFLSGLDDGRRPVASGEISTAKPDETRYPHLALGVLTITAFTLMTVPDTAIWIFSEPLGARVGLSAEAIGLRMALATLLGVFGAAIAAIVHTRFGRLLPFCIALTILALVVYGITHASTQWIYTLCLLPISFVILFGTPYFQGALAALDKSGSWTTLAGGVMSIAFAIGPLFAGLIITGASYETLGIFATACALGPLFIMIYVLRSPVFRDECRVDSLAQGIDGLEPSIADNEEPGDDRPEEEAVEEPPPPS